MTRKTRMLYYAILLRFESIITGLMIAHISAVANTEATNFLISI